MLARGNKIPHVISSGYLCSPLIFPQPALQDENYYKEIDYVSSRYLVLSIEALPGQARRAKVFQGAVPPKSAPNRFTIITVNGARLVGHMDDEIPF